MANANLTAAKIARNDEFYTQYPDIEKEVNAYLEYNLDTFRGKVVYSNCDDPYESNFFRYFVLNFKRLGLKQYIATSYKPSTIANTQLALLGDDATLPPAKGRPKVTANKFIINDVGDMDDDGQFNLEDVAEQLRANRNNEWAPLDGDGDFRSAECVDLLKQADIVVTNPPFSLFRDYLSQLVEHHKQFLIIGNMNAITYKEVFPLIKNDRLWLGATASGKDMVFAVPPGFEVDEKDKQKAARLGYVGDYTRLGNSTWFTNIDHGRRHQPLRLMPMADNLKFNKKLKGKTAYDRYDNYDAIEVPFTDAIPSDYDGIMGVPISFLDKYSPEQFEILGSDAYDGTPATKKYSSKIRVVDGKEMKSNTGTMGCVIREDSYGPGTFFNVGYPVRAVYKRIFIRHRRSS